MDRGPGPGWPGGGEGPLKLLLVHLPVPLSLLCPPFPGCPRNYWAVFSGVAQFKAVSGALVATVPFLTPKPE